MAADGRSVRACPARAALCAGQDSYVKVWCAATGALLTTLAHHARAVTCAAWVDLVRLVTGSHDSSVVRPLPAADAPLQKKLKIRNKKKYRTCHATRGCSGQPWRLPRSFPSENRRRASNFCAQLAGLDAARRCCCGAWWALSS